MTMLGPSQSLQHCFLLLHEALGGAILSSNSSKTMEIGFGQSGTKIFCLPTGNRTMAMRGRGYCVPPKFFIGVISKFCHGTVPAPMPPYPRLQDTRQDFGSVFMDLLVFMGLFSLRNCQVMHQIIQYMPSIRARKYRFYRFATSFLRDHFQSILNFCCLLIKCPCVEVQQQKTKI